MATIQEFQELLLFNDGQQIINYLLQHNWASTTDKTHFILYINNILRDLVYGPNRVFNEYDYNYIITYANKIPTIMQQFISDFQTIITKRRGHIIVPITHSQKPRKSSAELKFSYTEDNQTQQLLNSFTVKKKEHDTQNEANETTKTIRKYQQLLHKYKNEEISLEELLAGLTLNNGTYFKNNIPVLYKCQIDETMCQVQNEDGTVDEINTETWDYITSIVFEYIQLLGGNDIQIDSKEQLQIINMIQHFINDELKLYISQHKFGHLDYIVRIAFLAIYKFKTDYFDYQLYQKLLQLTEQHTIQFLQENNINHIDYSQIVDDWWQYQQNNGATQTINTGEQDSDDVVEYSDDNAEEKIMEDGGDE